MGFSATDGQKKHEQTEAKLFACDRRKPSATAPSAESLRNELAQKSSIHTLE
jgi:hypothetical protein